MATLKGTSLLFYHNGQPIAMQKGLSITLNNAINDASNKDSGGWWEGIVGYRDWSIDFSALFTTGLMSDVPKVLSAKDLYDSMNAGSRFIVTILDCAYPLIGIVYKNNLKFDAPGEGVMGLSGSVKGTGPLYVLRDTYADLFTDPDGSSNTYDTLTHTGKKITSAINLTGAAELASNTFAVTTGKQYMAYIYIDLNSGELPSVAIIDISNTSDATNRVTLVNGMNAVLLTATNTVTGALDFKNANAANWSTSAIYVFRSS